VTTLDDKLLGYKVLEHIGRMGTASRRGDVEKVRKGALTTLVLLRQQARHCCDLAEIRQAQASALEHALKKAAQADTSFPFVERRVRELRDELDNIRQDLADIGTGMRFALDTWQNAGATVDDLCNLCNRLPAQVKPHLPPDWESEPFSRLISLIDHGDFLNAFVSVSVK